MVIKCFARDAFHDVHYISLIKTVSAYLFLMGAVNPKASEVINLSIGRPVPANAQAPKGQKFNLTLQSTKRAASRSSYKEILYKMIFFLGKLQFIFQDAK